MVFNIDILYDFNVLHVLLLITLLIIKIIV